MALTRRALGGLTLGGSAAFTLAACGGNEGDGGSGATELTWGVSSAWESWNENTQSGNNSYGHQAMYPMRYGLDGNTSGDWDENGEFHLADQVFADAQVISEAPLQVEYTLQENAQWSDGQPIRVEDFIFQWYSISGLPEHADQTKALPASTSYGPNIASIEASEAGFVVTFVDGYLDPEWLYSPTIYLPSHVIEAEGFADWQTDPAVMGEAIAWSESNLIDVVVGPYKPVDYKMGQYITYELNDKWNGSVKPTVKKLTMKVVEGTPAIVTELRQGTIAGAWPSEFDQEQFDKAAEDQALAQEIYEGGVWLHIDTNYNSEPLKDQALRQAIFTAINVDDAIARVFPDTEVSRRLNHFFGVNSEYFVDHITPTGQGSGDTAAAAQILTEAGYTGAAEGETLTKDGTAVPNLVFRYGEGDAARTTIAELAQAQLALIGLTVDIVAIPDGDLGTVLTEGDFDLVIFGWSGSPSFVAAPNQYFETGVNYGSYSFPELDEAIAKVKSTSDVAEAAQFANDVEAIAVPLALTLPLFDEPQGILWNTNLIDGVVGNGNSQGGPIFNCAEWKTV
ncbi:ABC transporter family substrate-binding protein [Glycomyces sp. TRM65418]|uniref:ABC transporter family substrate-binding protein n=1 Tax=Glycomyces sp. TRM65418 TaxID=2867006 RepID=UPI001CE6167A|nr:ABC transporter family substrate-binding protein [Glycomyces sp. TRM65418]MCC3763702.1 ABC transporter family substrate-binding protein [Glycomyces sp. TRM65418]QZD57681.1 ABC transporter family substrate-binding protein [Glycomyces sp. TRM65418]